MTRISISSAREELADALNRVAYGGERILIHRRGKNVAAVVSVDDLKLIERLEDKIDLEMAREALADIKKYGTIPWKQIKKELESKKRKV
jgi:prevent-host-death family protein